MSHVDKILAALEQHGGSMTCTRIARATRIPSVLVYNYMPRLCKAGRAACVENSSPREYRRANVAVDEIVKTAKSSQPKWVFDLGGSPV